jgi:hypothetical protein
MDKEPGRRIAVSDDAVGPYAEHPMGHLLVRRDPASGVWPPAELGERSVEASCKGGQHNFGVELSDSQLRFCHQAPPLRLVWFVVPYMGCHPQVDRVGRRRVVVQSVLYLRLAPFQARDR